MAEFIRKKRFIKYTDKNCKKFLSRDFSRKCAYCQIREGDLSGPESFEKDHFIPSSMGGSNEYDNLYYSCMSCNGKAGKSDNWSKTLLDPCENDIWDVHVKVNDQYICESLTAQGEEYIKTFKLNRKSYINKRKIIAENQLELKEKIDKYKVLCESIIKCGDDRASVLEDSIQEFEHLLEEGANYRMSLNAFDEDIDELITSLLSELGKVDCVDKDYDLLYEVCINDKKFLCYVEIDDFIFDEKGYVHKYISVDKLSVWKDIMAEDNILIVVFNKNDKHNYYVRLEEILSLPGAENDVRCGYYIHESNKTLKCN